MSEAAMNVRLGAKTSEFNKALNKSTKKIQRFGKKMQSIGSSITRNFSMPFALAGGASVKMAMDFQKSLTKIQTLVGKSKEEVALMKEGILELSRDTAQAPVELADGLYFLTSAGLSGANAMETLEAVSKASASGLGDMEALSTVAAAAQNAYGEETLSAADALDKFGVMVQTGMFDAQELSNVLGKQLGLAANLGISFDEVGAMISTFTRTTGDATSATNGLSAIMMTFAKLDAEPTKQQAEALAAIGMSATEVSDSIQNQGLNATLLMLQEKFDANGISMASFFGKSQALKGVLGVLGNQTETYTQTLEDLGNSTGFVGDAFDETSQTDAFKMEQAMNNLKVAGTTFGEALYPVVNRLSEVINILTDKWNNLSDGTKKNIANVGTWIAIAGPAIVLIGKGVVMFAKARKAILMFSATVKAAGGIMKFFNMVMAANPIGFLVAVIAVVVGAIYYFATSSSEVAVTVRNVFYTAINFVIKVINGLITAVNKVANAVGLNGIPKIKELAKETYKAKEEVKDTSKEVENLSKEIKDIPSGQVDFSSSIDDGGDDDSGSDKDAEERINKENAALEKIRKLKQKFNVLNANDKHEADLIALENQRTNELRGVEDTKYSEEEKLAINKYYDKKRADLIAKETDRTSKELSDQEKEWQEYYKKISDGWKKATNVAGQFFSAVNGFLDAQQEKEETILNNKQVKEDEAHEKWYERRLLMIEQSNMTEEEKNTAKEALDETAAEKRKALDKQQDEEKKKLATEAARREKKINIFNAIINTGTAIVKALGSIPFPFNLGAAAFVGAMGAAQIATIRSTPIPMADGGIVFGPTNALVGEYKGAKNNPEVVAPLDKLKTMIGDRPVQAIEVFGRIDGNDIVISNNLTSEKRLRYT